MGADVNGASRSNREAQLDRRLNDVGWGLLVAALSQKWRTDLPLLAICLLVIGASLVAKPLLTKAA